VERFKREARAIAALNHPHICQLYDVGQDYLVMEYVEGEPLKSPLSPDEAVRLAIQIADALEAAHRNGIVHRDLKPGNILVNEGCVKLMDFGVAKMGDPGPDSDAFSTLTVGLTEAGAVVGTVAYMSPEQAQGQPVDARSDIFSFGLVLYELLSGNRAFAGESAFATMWELSARAKLMPDVHHYRQRPRMPFREWLGLPTQTKQIGSTLERYHESKPVKPRCPHPTALRSVVRKPAWRIDFS
jgi:serine/threonine protein kinase